MSNTAVVIGASGFVGAQLRHHISQSELHTFLLLISRQKYSASEDRIHPISMSETARLVSVIPPDATVYLLAWDSSPATAGLGVDAASDRNVIEHVALIKALAVRGVARLVFVSSGGTVYGEPEHLPISENHALNPINAYGAAKALVEQKLVEIGQRYNIDYTIARLANLYGGGQVVKKSQGLIAAIRACVVNHMPLSIWGDGSVVRDYVHIDDAVAALIACGTEEKARQKIYNIGTGRGASILDVIGMVEKIIGRKIDVRFEPRHSVDVSKNILDITSIQRDLNWSPTVALEAGLAEIFTPLKSA